MKKVPCQLLTVLSTAIGCSFDVTKAQTLSLQLTSGITWHIPVEPGWTYRAQWSRDLTSWDWLGDSFLPSENLPLPLPDSPMGFVRFKLGFKVPETTLRVVILGDSTIADLSHFAPQWNGWGQWLPEFFTDRVSVVNYAEPGLGTGAVIDQGRMTWVERVEPDVVFMQFGNFEEFHGISLDVFELNMSVIIDAVRAMSAIPIMATPMADRVFNDQGVIVNRLRPYSESILKTARNQNVQWVDLNKITEAFYNLHGDDTTVFITGCGDACPDRRHFSRAGAYVMSALAMEEFPPLLKAYSVPLETLVDDVLLAFESDRRFDGLRRRFVDLTGLEDEQIWTWVFPTGFSPGD